MASAPVLDREEYIEQAYFFHAFRERLVDGLPAQEILARVSEELLSTTKLPLAVSFLYTEIKGSGLMAPAMTRIGHYFTAFQTHVIGQAEITMSRFSMEQALLVLEPLVSRAMSPVAADRFATADEMLRALLDVHASATSMTDGLPRRSLPPNSCESQARTTIGAAIGV